jgi:two-component system chemotaxis response regulator CheB
MTPLKVLIVEDSATMRRMLGEVFQGDPSIKVVGTAANGLIGLTLVESLQPDLITLDVEMPEMDGLTMLRELRKTHRRLPVIMVSTVTARGASATLEALSRGANDYVTKPSGQSNARDSITNLKAQLIPKVKALCGAVAPVAGSARPGAPGPSALSRGVAGRGALARPLVGRPLASRSLAPGARGAAAPAAPPTRPSMLRPKSAASRVDVLAVASSTGGPNALEVFLGALPSNFPVPIVIVQHMPPLFTKMLAERLDGRSSITVHEAERGMPLQAGHAYIAPGDHHMALDDSGAGVRISINQQPPENSCRPAADVLFRSVTEVYGDRALAVVLTGMGSDGCKGAEAIVAAGGEVLAQDQATSVVWGMPGAVATAGLATEVLALERLPAAVEERVSRWPGMRLTTTSRQGAR